VIPFDYSLDRQLMMLMIESDIDIFKMINAIIFIFLYINSLHF